MRACLPQRGSMFERGRKNFLKKKKGPGGIRSPDLQDGSDLEPTALTLPLAVAERHSFLLVWLLIGYLWHFFFFKLACPTAHAQ